MSGSKEGLGKAYGIRWMGKPPYAVYRMQSTVFTLYPLFVTLLTGGGFVPGLRASL
jgi:hypothetical protein